MENTLYLSEIEAKVVELLDAQKQEFVKVSNTHITKTIKELLQKEAEIREFEVLPNGNDGQWLYDLIWYKNNNEGFLESIELILESELSYGLNHIKYDFEKLLQAKSKNKIMICISGNLKIDTIKDYCQKSVDAYQWENRILLLILDDHDTGNFFHFIIEKK